MGVALVLTGLVVLSLGSLGESNASAGGFILLGPFPIIFGAGTNGPQLALLSVIAGGIMLLLLALWAWRVSHVSDSEK